MAQPTPWKKPRKADEGTIHYVASIALLTSGSQPTDADQDNDDADVVENVLEELKTKTASVICEKKACVCMQELVYKANAQQLCTVLERLLPYAQFLSTNRDRKSVV